MRTSSINRVKTSKHIAFQHFNVPLHILNHKFHMMVQSENQSWAKSAWNFFPHCSIQLPPKGRWILVDIYRDVKRRDIYPSLFTYPEGDSCFSILPNQMDKKMLLQFLLLKLLRNDTPFFSPFAKQCISKDIPSYGSQSKCAKIAIHWFGKY